MTKREKSARIVGYMIGAFLLLAIVMAALLCWDEVWPGGAYHPENWALIWQHPAALLLPLSSAAGLALLWPCLSSRLLRVGWPAAMKQAARCYGFGALGTLTVLALLLALSSIRFII